MKPVSATRAQEIAQFSAAVRAAGARLAPRASDAERIRVLADELGAGAPSVKKWWYGQNAPRGAAAAILLREIECIGVEIDAAEILEI